MAHKILILDDDADFNSLLTDIFEQADYQVTSIEDPLEAQEAFSKAQFDLVVTDHRMPEMTGSEFMRKIKGIRPEVPVIMVSGYLENDTIRDLIREGVGGVFLKPLNIFSLLERTSELIEESRRSSRESGEAAEEKDPGADFAQSSLSFPFRSFPCKSRVSTAFAEQLYGLRNFKSTLSLIGGKGTHFRAICDDILGFQESDGERFLFFTPANFDTQAVEGRIGQAMEEGSDRVTCVVLDLEAMSDEQKRLALGMARREGGFGSLEAALRMIFCINGDLDTLYEEGKIDEELYIVMGTAEVAVPSLKDCPEDIPFMAQQIAYEVVREKGRASVPRFDSSARDFLRGQEWPDNHAGLREKVALAVASASSGVITKAMLEDASAAASPVAFLSEELKALRGDFVRAAACLLGDDRGRLGEFLGVSPESLPPDLKG